MMVTDVDNGLTHIPLRAVNHLCLSSRPTPLPLPIPTTPRFPSHLKKKKKKKIPCEDEGKQCGSGHDDVGPKPTNWSRAARSDRGRHDATTMAGAWSGDQTGRQAGRQAGRHGPSPPPLPPPPLATTAPTPRGRKRVEDKYLPGVGRGQ